MKALDLLKSTGDCNSFIGRPLPIKNTNASSKTDSSRHSSTSTQSATPAGASHIPSASSSKPATNRQVPLSKSGNLKSVRDFFQASPNKKQKHEINPTSPKLPALEAPLQNQWREGRTRNNTSEHLHRTETRKQNQELTNFEKCTHLYSKNGSQTTEWKLVVYHAINSENKQLSDIARSIRKRCGTSGWDGKSTCKEFQKLRQVVRRALTVMKSNKFDAEKLASMSRSEAGKILKRKKTKM